MIQATIIQFLALQLILSARLPVSRGAKNYKNLKHRHSALQASEKEKQKIEPFEPSKFQKFLNLRDKQRKNEEEITEIEVKKSDLEELSNFQKTQRKMKENEKGMLLQKVEKIIKKICFEKAAQIQKFIMKDSDKQNMINYKKFDRYKDTEASKLIHSAINPQLEERGIVASVLKQIITEILINIQFDEEELLKAIKIKRNEDQEGVPFYNEISDGKLFSNGEIYKEYSHKIFQYYKMDIDLLKSIYYPKPNEKGDQKSQNSKSAEELQKQSELNYNSAEDLSFFFDRSIFELVFDIINLGNKIIDLGSGKEMFEQYLEDDKEKKEKDKVGEDDFRKIYENIWQCLLDLNNEAKDKNIKLHFLVAEKIHKKDLDLNEDFTQEEPMDEDKKLSQSDKKVKLLDFILKVLPKRDYLDGKIEKITLDSGRDIINVSPYEPSINTNSGNNSNINQIFTGQENLNNSRRNEGHPLATDIEKPQIANLRPNDKPLSQKPDSEQSQTDVSNMPKEKSLVIDQNSRSVEISKEEDDSEKKSNKSKPAQPENTTTDKVEILEDADSNKKEDIKDKQLDLKGEAQKDSEGNKDGEENFLKKYIVLIIIGCVLLVLAPITLTIFNKRNSAKK